MSSFYIHTLGCPKNNVDSSQLEGLLLSHGFVNTSLEFADFLLINTCTFINEAKEESINEILKLCSIKDDSKLIVFGCLAQRYKDELMREIPEIDFIVGLNGHDEILQYCNKHCNKTIDLVKSPNYAITPKLTYTYLKIADGCDRKCSFCIIPSLRGRFKSIYKDTLLEQAKRHIEDGYKELILIGQDITAYGKEMRSYNLIDLLKDISRIDGDFNIRLLYLNPSGITDELIELVATEDKILKYLDIPLQHSEDRILRLMKRQGSRNEYLKLMRKIRKRIPDIALRTTFIVGFPTETEDEFHNLMDFIEEVKFDRLGVFKYSRQEGTPSASIKGQITNAVKDRRYHRLMSAQAQISYDKNTSLIGRRFKAIVDDIDDLSIIARIYSQAPDIDGVTIVDLRQNPLSEGNNIYIGDYVEVEITSVYEYDLLGRVIQKKD